MHRRQAAAAVLSWLAPRNVLANEVRSAGERQAAMNRFAARYGDWFASAER